MDDLEIQPLTPLDHEWVSHFLREHWGDETMVVHGQVFHPAELPGFAARVNGRLAGLATYALQGDTCELISLDALESGRGIGSALLQTVTDAARAAGCRRLLLTTTNDNLKALRFYQRCGLRLCALRPGAVDEARKIKPAIPLIGNDGLPLRDELDLEIEL